MNSRDLFDLSSFFSTVANSAMTPRSSIRSPGNAAVNNTWVAVTPATEADYKIEWPTRLLLPPVATGMYFADTSPIFWVGCGRSGL
jgi:hypothetical protein